MYLSDIDGVCRNHKQTNDRGILLVCAISVAIMCIMEWTRSPVGCGVGWQRCSGAGVVVHCHRPYLCCRRPSHRYHHPALIRARQVGIRCGGGASVGQFPRVDVLTAGIGNVSWKSIGADLLELIACKAASLQLCQYFATCTLECISTFSLCAGSISLHNTGAHHVNGKSVSAIERHTSPLSNGRLFTPCERAVQAPEDAASRGSSLSMLTGLLRILKFGEIRKNSVRLGQIRSTAGWRELACCDQRAQQSSAGSAERP